MGINGISFSAEESPLHNVKKLKKKQKKAYRNVQRQMINNDREPLTWEKYRRNNGMEPLNKPQSGVVEADKIAEEIKRQNALEAQKAQHRQNIADLQGKKSGVVVADEIAEKKAQHKQNIADLKGKKSGVVVADELAAQNKAAKPKTWANYYQEHGLKAPEPQKSGVVVADEIAEGAKSQNPLEAQKAQHRQNIADLKGKKSGVVVADKIAEGAKSQNPLEAQKAQLRQNIADLKGKRSGVVVADDIAGGIKRHNAMIGKKGGNKIFKSMKGKKGKAALAALGVGLIGGVIAYFNQKDKTPTVEATPAIPVEQNPKPADSTGTQQPAIENPAAIPPAAVPPAEEPATEKPATEYIVKKGDCVWNIAKQHLKDLHKSDPNYKPTDKEILEHTKELMKLNNLKYEADGYVVIIHPEDRLKLTA